ncbi:MAG: methyltransferase [Solirubrobacteraceae bacterium]
MSSERTVPRLWTMADLITPMAIRVAATLRLSDHIDAGTRTAAGLAERTGAAEGALDCLLEHLVTIGVLTGDADRYQLTDLGRELRDDHPFQLRAWLDLEGPVGRGELSLLRLLDTVRTGKPAYPLVFGRGFWEDLAADSALSASFDALMNQQLAEEAPGLARAYDWSSLGHLVDLGGGDGTLLAAILTAHPSLTGTVLELPGVAAAAEQRFTREGLTGRARAVAGSFFDALPPGGSYLLANVLHDWDDEHALAVLRRCAHALGENDRVLLVEGLNERTGAHAPRTDMDLRMLAFFAGRERSLQDFAGLAKASGLKLRSSTPGPGPRSIIELSRRRDQL